MASFCYALVLGFTTVSAVPTASPTCEVGQWGKSVAVEWLNATFSAGSKVGEQSEPWTIKYGVRHKKCIQHDQMHLALYQRSDVCLQADNCLKQTCTMDCSGILSPFDCNAESECQWGKICDMQKPLLTDYPTLFTITKPEDGIFDCAFADKCEKQDATSQIQVFDVTLNPSALADAALFFSKNKSPTSEFDTMTMCARSSAFLGTGRNMDDEVLFEETVVTIRIHMLLGFEVIIDLTRQGAKEKRENIQLEGKIIAFHCDASEEDLSVEYVPVPIGTVTLAQNTVLKVCVIPVSKDFQCAYLENMVFKQDGRVKETPVLNRNQVNFPQLTQKENKIWMRYENQRFKGCVVTSQLRALYFKSINPSDLEVTGNARLAVASRQLRRLSDSSAENDAQFFELRMKLAASDEGALPDEKFVPSEAVPSNSPELSGASHIAGAAVLLNSLLCITLNFGS